MTTFISKSLARKREMLANDEKGFTLIELLIVVLIIGVLAAIAIPVYLTTQGSAKENAVKSSVTEAKTAVMADYTESGTFQTNLANLDGFSESDNVRIRVFGNVTSFCIVGAWFDGTADDSPEYEYFTTESIGTTAGARPATGTSACPAAN